MNIYGFNTVGIILCLYHVELLCTKHSVISSVYCITLFRAGNTHWMRDPQCDRDVGSQVFGYGERLFD